MLQADSDAGAGDVSFGAARIAALSHETSSVLELELEAFDNKALLEPLPGQFVSVRFKPSSNVSAVVRSFSLCGPPATGRYRLGIKSNPDGTASRALVERANVGDILDVSPPMGSFVLEPGNGPIVLVGAGIGITPLLAMLYAVVFGQTHRDVWWIYGARSRAEHPFANDVRSLLASLAHVHAHTRYSRPGAKDVIERDYDSVGHVDAALIERCAAPREADFYLCGPGAMLDDVGAGLRAWGVNSKQIHSEVFASTAAATMARVGESPVASLAAPRVSFARSGLAVRWKATDRTLLDLAERCDVSVPWLCRLGMCHTCETALLSGTVRYNPVPIEPPDAASVLLCCAQPVDDIVLDR